jgi:hypothetical protein
MGMERDLMFTQYSLISSNTLLKNTLIWWKVFNLAKNTVVWKIFVVMSQDYLLQT